MGLTDKSFVKKTVSHKNEGEREFFKLLVLSEMVNTPAYMVNNLIDIDPMKLFVIAKQ